MKRKLIRITTIGRSFNLLKHQLSFLNQYYEVLGIASPGVKLDETSKRECIKTFGIPMERHISIFKDLISLYKLIKIFRKEKPWCIHSITPKAGLLSMVAGWITQVPVRIHTFTGLVFPTSKGVKKYILMTSDRLLCKCATNVYAEGQGVKFDLIRHKITQKPLKVLANGNINGIDTAYFSPTFYTNEQNEKLKSEIGIPRNAFVFCFVGRLVKDKGINELVQAFIEINKTCSYIKLLLVGLFERELDPLLPETEKEIQNHPNIIFVGYQTDVRPYLVISDIFVFPSYREGFPNVVMQAGAMELPCIVTDINGCNEIIEDGVNGSIIPPKDKGQLQEKMELLLKDSDLRSQLKQNARRMITSRYEQKPVWKALLDEYKKLEDKDV